MQGSGPAAESASDDWPCEKQGYLCTWEEVDDDVAERSRVLGEAALDRLVPRAYPYQFVSHTFKAKFWAEIRREATLPGSLPAFIDLGARP